MSLKLSILVVMLLGVVSDLTAQQSPPLTFGDPKADNKIEVFYDLQCGGCVGFHERLKKVMTDQPERVYVIFRHFPLQMHERAFMASSVADAAKKQGKGLEMITLLLQEQSKWSTTKSPYPMMFRYAERVGLDVPRLQKDVISDDVILNIVLDMNRAKRLEVASVPAVFVNGRMLSFPEFMDLENNISKGN